MLAVIDLHVIDPEHDANPKIAVVHRQTSQPQQTGALLESYDVVDVPGVVSVHRNAQAVRLASGDGLLDWTSRAPNSDTRSLLRYEAGAWHVVSQALASLPQGDPDGF
jgi:hypothetical protein